MRYLVLLLAVTGLFFSCKKKSPGTTCWAVIAYDSTYVKNKDTTYTTKYKQTGMKEICDFTGNMIQEYIRMHSPTIDTGYMSDDSVMLTFQYEVAQVW